VSLFFRLARQLRRRGVTIAHCHDELAWFYASVAARLVPGVRVVVTFHGRRPNIGARHRQEQRLLARFASALVAVSEPLQKTLVDELGLASDRVKLIVNGIPMAPPADTEARQQARKRLGVPEDAFVVGTVGEMSPVKNLTLAIDAVKAARADIPNVRLVLVGDGAERANLEAAVARHGLDQQVVMTGVRRDVPKLLPAFDAYVCSSRYEGTSLSLLEAMSCGLPIVATDVGGNRELLGDGEYGRLVPLDNVGTMRSALVRHFQNPERRQALGLRAAAFVRSRYSIDAMISAYAALYRSVAGRSAFEPRADVESV
jgi:glycosyltransferase involved in cell wall biosynthesis